MEKIETKILRNVFNKFDTEHSGHLGATNFFKFMTSLVRNASHNNESITFMDQETCEAAFMYYDTDSDDKISFDEICEWWYSPNKFLLFSEENKKNLCKAKNLFLQFMSPHQKQLSYSEFEKLLEFLNVNHKTSTFDTIDKNDNGLMSFREFVDWLKWIK